MQRALILLPFLLLSFAAFAVEPGDSVALPAPETTGGMPLMDALSARKSVRKFNDDPIADQILSNLLWAAWGINRPDKGKRTAPSATNAQEVDVYVVREDGAWRYDAEEHALVLVTSQDIRRATGHQPLAGKAPLNLIYVADYSRFGIMVPAEHRAHYASADTGFIAQNAYLYCSSAGLGSVARGWYDAEALHGLLGLSADQHVTLAQTVGWPE